MGKTCSGKDTVAKELCRRADVDRIVTYTTRPPSDHEVNGRDYHFVSDAEFDRMIADGEFAEYKAYYPACGDVWKYGSKLADKEIQDDRMHIIILTPAGYRDVKAKYPGEKDIFSVYLTCSDDILRKRLRKRNDDPTEAERRLTADDRDFAGVEDEADIVIENTTKPGVTADLIAETVIEERRHRKAE